MTLLRKVQAAKEINRRKGWLVTSHKCLPLGVSYDKSTRKFFYNEAIHRVIEGFRLLDEERLSLSEIGRRIDVHPGNVRGMLEQEIYATGDRVYSKKCDLSVKRVGVGGKQRARPRIARAPDEIIRVKVIDQPAVSETISIAELRTPPRPASSKNFDHHHWRITVNFGDRRPRL
jgi:hypothetical protein